MLNDWPSMANIGLAKSGYILTIIPASESIVNSDLLFKQMQIKRLAHKGLYPVSFTLWNTCTYNVLITSDDDYIQRSPTTIYVVNAPVGPTARSGLKKIIAGDSFTIKIQAKDTRQTSVRCIISSAFVTSFFQEVQLIQIFTSLLFTLKFRGQSSSAIIPRFIFYLDHKTYLNNLKTFSISNSFRILNNLDVTLEDSSLMIEISSFQLSFVSSYSALHGSLPLVLSNNTGISIFQLISGDAPYRLTIQLISSMYAMINNSTPIFIQLDLKQQ